MGLSAGGSNLDVLSKGPYCIPRHRLDPSWAVQLKRVFPVQNPRREDEISEPHCVIRMEVRGKGV